MKKFKGMVGSNWIFDKMSPFSSLQKSALNKSAAEKICEPFGLLYSNVLVFLKERAFKSFLAG